MSKTSNQTTAKMISTDHRILINQDKASLATEYRRHYPLLLAEGDRWSFSVEGLPKADIVFTILCTRYGAKAVAAAFNR